MSITIPEITDFLLNENIAFLYNGSKDLLIETFCSLNSLKDHAVTWARDANKVDYTRITMFHNLLVLKEDMSQEEKGINAIYCQEPRAVYFSILSEFFKKEEKAQICQDSVILTKQIGENVSVGHNCYIGADVIIYDDVVIRNNVVIECPTKIGKGTIINSGVIIGTDGYGYYKKEDGSSHKVPHFGGVILGENVEIGANTCIDRGTLDNTIIENGVKIDNLCHIAHNVHIKQRAYVIALSVLGGSSILEEDAYIAPGAIIKNQVKIGSNSLVGMGAVVTKDVEANKVVAGVPAKVLREVQ